MIVERIFTKDLTGNIFDSLEWKSFDVCLKDHRSDKVLYELNGIKAPPHWSQQSVDVMASKYFRRAEVPLKTKKSKVLPADLNISETQLSTWPEWLLPNVSNDGDLDVSKNGESSVQQVFHRLAGAWAFWGKVSGLLDIDGESSNENIQAFYDEVIYMLYHQIAAPNSPQFFNTGVWWAYGIAGKACGHSYADVNGEVHQSENLYSRSQAHACFILGIEDNLLDENGIYDLLRKEARIFKLGSGAGTNFSPLRAEGERLSGGGTSSGLISFLRIFDRAADCIKSGGITRRAAKMLVVDVDHPDILEYINWKSEEERKAQALIAAGYESDFNGEAYKTVSGQNGNNSIAVSHDFMTSLEGDQEWPTWWRTDKAKYTDENGKTDWDTLKKECNPARIYKSAKIWNKMIDSSWKCADPAIHFNGTMNDWNTLASDGWIYSTNPCAEYISLNDTACNLASINVEKLYDEEKKIFEVEKYKHSIRIWQMILEITNHMAQLPSELVAYNVWKYRSTGLGPANLGTLLMLMGLPYDGDESRTIGAALMGIMTGHSYAVSAEMAEALGPFEGYDNNRKDMLKVVKNHRSASYGMSSNLDPKTHQELSRSVGDYKDLTVPPVPLNTKSSYRAQTNVLVGEAQTSWDEAVSMGGSFGYRNSQVTVCAPTGCLVSDTMILSSDGLIPIVEMGNPEGDQWQNIERDILQENNISKSDKFYINGIAPTIRVQSDRGHVIQATFNHQLRVINDDGEYVWKKMEDIEEGDLLSNKIGGHEDLLLNKEYQDLSSVDISHHSIKLTKTPSKLDESLAELLGLYQGDGYVKDSSGIRIAVCNDDKDLVSHIDNLNKVLFGLNNIAQEEKVGCSLIILSSRVIARWWRQNGFDKPSGNEGQGSAGAFIPIKVLRSKTSVLCAFLRGLFEADGTINGTTSPIIEMTTTSYVLSRQVFVALESLGIKAHWKLYEVREDGFGSRVKYRVRVSGSEAAYKYMHKIGFISQRKIDKLVGFFEKRKEMNSNPKNTIHHIGWINELYDLSNGLSNKIRQDILVRKKEGRFNYDWAVSLINEFDQLKKSKFYNVVSKYPELSFVRINSVDYAGEEATYDISVPSENTYVANGIISHNTISFIMGCDSTGIEPCYALVTYKTLAGGGMMKIVNNSVKRSLFNLKSYTEDEIDSICTFIQENGHVKGSGIKSEHENIFKCAASPLGDEGIIGWEGHIRMLASLQSFVSGGISKTINMPESSSHVDISEAWKMAYQLGCKGISIYRDNCKMSAPLNTERNKDQNISEDVVQRITNESIMSELSRRKQTNALNVQEFLDAVGITHHDIIEAKKEWGERKRPADVLNGLRFRIKIGSSQGYVQIFVYPDGRICEFFLTFGNPGSSLNNMLECWSIAFSIALQRGEPLHNLCSKYMNVEFEPKGFTGRKDELRRVTSPVDYIARLMLMYFDDEGYIKDPSVLSVGNALEIDEVKEITEEGTTISGFEFSDSKDKKVDNTSGFMQRQQCPKCSALMTGGSEKCPVCPSCGYFGGCG